MEKKIEYNPSFRLLYWPLDILHGEIKERILNGAIKLKPNRKPKHR